MNIARSLIVFLFAILFSLGCVHNEGFEIPEKQILFFGKLDSMRDSMGYLLISPEFLDFSKFDEDYIEEYTMGSRISMINYEGPYMENAQTGQKTIFYVNRKTNEYGELMVDTFVKENWYDFSIQNGLLKLTIKNPLNIEVKNLTVQGTHFDEILIDKILPGESKELKWNVDCKKRPLYFEIKSKCISKESYSITKNSLTDLCGSIIFYVEETIWATPLGCPKPADIRLVSKINHHSPPKMLLDEPHIIEHFIRNEGDLDAIKVPVKLKLSPELETSEELVKYVDIKANSEEKITWGIRAIEGGLTTYELSADYNGDYTEDIVFLSVITYDHDIKTILDETHISEENTLYINDSNHDIHIINMTIINYGDIEDQVFFQYLVAQEKYLLYFRIYDGHERIISQNVAVPPKGNKTISLKISMYNLEPLPENTEITIHTTSEFDPTAGDRIDINVKPLK